MEELTLRPLEEGDVPLVESWLQQDHVRRWFEHPEDWMAELGQRHGEFAWIHHFIVMHGGEPMGFCQYYDCYDAKEEWYDLPRSGEVYSPD